MNAARLIDRARPAWTLLLVAALLSAGCAGPVVVQSPQPAGGAPRPSPATPQEPLSKYGNPDSYIVFGKRYYTLKSAEGFIERGVASWYGDKFHGRKTSSGEIYDMYLMTAAHKELPLPTYVEVRNLENNRAVVLRVNDRGPFHENRIIDVSYAAALKLDLVQKGTALVEVRALTSPDAGTSPDPHPAPRKGAEKIFIQIGAFKDRQNAQRLVGQVNLVLPGLVAIFESHESGGAIYRVQVGPVADVAAADALVTALTASGLGNFRFVVR